MGDLLDSLSDDVTGTEVVDLLGTMTDAGAPAWVPEDAGEGVQGIVTAVEEQPDEFKPGETVPVVTLQLADGESVRVIGFSSVLRREILNHNPERGDTMAVKYFGERELTKGPYKGRPYKLFKVAVAKAK
jgi:hypothetical protein